MLPALHQNQAKSGPYSALPCVRAVKISLSISLCILRDLPQQKIHRELCSEGDPAIFLCSHVPMERFFDGTESGKFKNTRRKGTDQENSKKQEGKNGGEKKKIFLGTWRFLYLCVLDRCPHGATFPQENPLVWEPPLQHYSSRAHGLRTSITNFWGLIFILW